MEAPGGSLLEQKLEELRVALDDYYGVIVEIQMGSTVPLPEPPQALLYYKMCRDMNMQLVEGGVIDQPHIWLMEYAICHQKTELYSRQDKSGQDTPAADNIFAQDILP